MVADRLGPRPLLDELRADVEVIDAAKIPYGRSMAQEADQPTSGRARQGRASSWSGSRAATRSSSAAAGGGRGLRRPPACRSRWCPGVTSAIAVPAAAGIPVTHRGVAHEFTVVSGHVAAGHPQSLVDWAALARLRGTLVLLMGVEHLAADRRGADGARPRPPTPVAVVSDGSTRHQRTVRTTLAGLPATRSTADIRPPAVWVVGDVVARDRGSGVPRRAGRRGSLIRPAGGQRTTVAKTTVFSSLVPASWTYSPPQVTRATGVGGGGR